MRNTWLVCVILFLSATWVVAQAGGNGGTAGSSNSGSNTDAGAASAGGQNTQGAEAPGSNQNPSTNQNTQNTHANSRGANKTEIEGCLSGSSGSYTLAASNGTTYQLQGKDSDLNKHVGQEVKVTGTPASAGGGMASNASSSSTPSGSSTSGTQTLEVSKVKKVSKTCTSGNNSNPSSRQ